MRFDSVPQTSQPTPTPKPPQGERPSAPPKAFIVTMAQTPAKETTVADVIIGSLGVAGALLLLAIVLGVVASLVRLAWNRRHPPHEAHLPSVSPFTPDETPSRSSRSR